MALGIFRPALAGNLICVHEQDSWPLRSEDLLRKG
jgi:hypothetical protein